MPRAACGGGTFAAAGATTSGVGTLAFAVAGVIFGAARRCDGFDGSGFGVRILGFGAAELGVDVVIFLDAGATGSTGARAVDITGVLAARAGALAIPAGGVGVSAAVVPAAGAGAAMSRCSIRPSSAVSELRSSTTSLAESVSTIRTVVSKPGLASEAGWRSGCTTAAARCSAAA